MLNIKTTILTITACYTSFSCSPESDQRIKNEKGNYSITKLANWDYKLKNRSTMIEQTSNFDSLEVTGSILIAPADSELSLEDTFDAIQRDLPNSLQDFQKINEGSTEINGRQTKWLKLSYTLYDFKYISLRYYLKLSEKKAVMIDCSSINGTFEYFEEDFNKMAFSLRVEK